VIRVLGAALLVAGLLVAGAGWATGTGDRGPVVGEPVEFDGRTLFTAKGCIGCHTGPDGVAGGGVGPDLGGLTATADDVRRSIVTPDAETVPGFSDVMPRLPLSDAEVSALVEYLTSSR
jgi:cytochrome c oxidase subunit 2